MRSKALGLGLFSALLWVILVSGKVIEQVPELNGAAGERIPSIQVNGVDLQQYPKVQLLLWSRKDAKSRMVNVWLSQKQQDAPFISVCIDADTETAKRYAAVDGVETTTHVVGIDASKDLANWLSTKKQLGAILFENGIIKEPCSAEKLWSQIAHSHL